MDSFLTLTSHEHNRHYLYIYPQTKAEYMNVIYGILTPMQLYVTHESKEKSIIEIHENITKSSTDQVINWTAEQSRNQKKKRKISEKNRTTQKVLFRETVT
jgi:hypothetical protein